MQSSVFTFFAQELKSYASVQHIQFEIDAFLVTLDRFLNVAGVDFQ